MGKLQMTLMNYFIGYFNWK